MNQPDEKAFYRPTDLQDIDYENKIGDPGQYPMTRGIYPDMYRGQIWTMRQYAGFGTAEESNERYKFLLKQGQSGLSVALDLPTQLGLDSDDPLALGEVGKVGVAIDTLRDMEILFEGLPIDKVSTSFTINAPAAILLAMYLVVGEKQGIPGDRLRGTIQNDILKEYIARGTWIFPARQSLKLATDAIEYCTRKAPNFYPISICGYHIREAGASAVQELAFTLADALVYVQAAVERGLDIDQFAPRLSFFFSAQSNFFEEIAKFRAARNLWAKMMKERFSAKKTKSWMMRIGIACSGSTLQAKQPQNNILRVAYQALEAALGGVQSIFTCAWDEPFAIPSSESAELAIRTQQVLAHETGITGVADPFGGSYYIESLTTRIEDETLNLMRDVENRGGMVSLIEEGVVQGMILDQAYAHEKKLRSGEIKIVGVNLFTSEEKTGNLNLYQASQAAFHTQLARLRRVKEERNLEAVQEALKRLAQAARENENLMPYLIDAVRQYATIGEITQLLKKQYGEFNEPRAL
jgi:methylmalonyl-CoA mutase, N-terminal domain